METGEITYEKAFASPRPLPKISLRNNWMKEFVSEVARQAESSQPTQPNPNPIYRTGRPVEIEQTSRSSVQEIDARFSLDCENTNLCVERLDKNTDADKDVDADRVRTGRPVWIATCSCDTSRQFSCSRTREENRESPSSTRSSSRCATK